jgi:hypothetical protein
MSYQNFVEVPAWFRKVRLVQIGLAVLILILNAVGIALFSYGGVGYGIFTVRVLRVSKEPEANNA